jgi:hypothetical protein
VRRSGQVLPGLAAQVRACCSIPLALGRAGPANPPNRPTNPSAARHLVSLPPHSTCERRWRKTGVDHESGFE